MISDELMQLISCLKESVEFHNRGEYFNIADKYDEVYNDLLTMGKFELRNVQIAMNFWDSWSDSAEHDWYHYEPLRKDDWPKLAIIIINHLEEGSDITEKIILDKFAPENKAGCFWPFRNKK